MNVDKCLPLIIPEDDKFYKKFNVTCLEQTRSINTEMKGCKMTPCAPVKYIHLHFYTLARIIDSYRVEDNQKYFCVFQINHATSYLDLSILYTADEGYMDDMRTHEGGLLKTKDNELEHSYPEITSGINCPLGGIKPELLGSCFNVGLYTCIDWYQIAFKALKTFQLELCLEIFTLYVGKIALLEKSNDISI